MRSEWSNDGKEGGEAQGGWAREMMACMSDSV
jgi:hypothetical protein